MVVAASGVGVGARLPAAALPEAAEDAEDPASGDVGPKALAEERTIRETVLEMGFVEKGDLTEEQLDAALDVASMTHP